MSTFWPTVLLAGPLLLVLWILAVEHRRRRRREPDWHPDRERLIRECLERPIDPKPTPEDRRELYRSHFSPEKLN